MKYKQYSEMEEKMELYKMPNQKQYKTENEGKTKIETKNKGDKVKTNTKYDRYQSNHINKHFKYQWCKYMSKKRNCQRELTNKAQLCIADKKPL